MGFSSYARLYFARKQKKTQNNLHRIYQQKAHLLLALFGPNVKPGQPQMFKTPPAPHARRHRSSIYIYTT